MEKEEEHSNKNIELAKQFIKSEETWSRLRNKLIGYFDADNDFYDLKRENIVVINSKKQEALKNKKRISAKRKGDADMKNIYYHHDENRYMGRKQIKKHIITVYGRTQKECLKKLNEKVKEFYSNKIALQIKSQPTFLERWNKWFDETKRPYLSKESTRDIERIRDKLVDLHKIAVTKISKDVIISTLKNFEEGRAKEKIIIYLKAFFKHEFQDGMIKKNPFANIVTAPRVFNRRKAFTYEQQVAILERLKKEEIKPVILIYLVTGLRRRELDFQNIDKNLYQEDNTYYLKAVNLKGRNKITRYKTIQLSKKAFCLIKNNIELLKTFNDDTCYRKFAEILNELNIEGGIVTLRHTYATNNFYLGNPELFISRQMGHSTSQITKDNYTDLDYHLSKEKVLKLYNNLYLQF